MLNLFKNNSEPAMLNIVSSPKAYHARHAIIISDSSFNHLRIHNPYDRITQPRQSSQVEPRNHNKNCQVHHRDLIYLLQVHF